MNSSATSTGPDGIYEPPTLMNRASSAILLIVTCFVAFSGNIEAQCVSSQRPDSAGTMQAKELPAARIALEGIVASQQEGPMEGVLISVEREDSNVTTTVVSDANGCFKFPADRLTKGKYELSIRAIGYQLEKAPAITIKKNKTEMVVLNLEIAEDITGQLTNAEWFMSIPGTKEEKEYLYTFQCVGCHTLQRVITAQYTVKEWEAVLHRMRNYTYNSSADVAIKMPYEVSKGPHDKELAEYLAYLTSPGTKFDLKTLPRPHGEATRVIITEYELPRKNAQPHDAVVDPEGFIWYADFAFPFLGRLDPNTGRVSEYAIPKVKKDSPGGGLDVEIDEHGNVWVSLLYQSSIARFSRDSYSFKIWSLPEEYDSPITRTGMLSIPKHGEVVSVWLHNPMFSTMHRLELQSEKWDSFPPPGIVIEEQDREVRGFYPDIVRRAGYSMYGIAQDSLGNAYFVDPFVSGKIGRIAQEDGSITFYSPPTKNSGPRRTFFDDQDRLWFSQFFVDQIGMLDTKSGQFQEWLLPTKWSGPYDVVVDQHDQIWTGGMMTDRIIRIDPNTEVSTEYLLPRTTNVRRLDVDNATTPATVWIGNNHGASIIRLEPQKL